MQTTLELSTSFVNKCFETTRGYPTHRSFFVREIDKHRTAEPGMRAWYTPRQRWVNVVATMGGMMQIEWLDFNHNRLIVRVCIKADLIVPYGTCKCRPWQFQ